MNEIEDVNDGLEEDAEEKDTEEKPTQKRGFARMSREDHLAVSSKGGKSVPAEKRPRFNSQTGSEAGKTSQANGRVQRWTPGSEAARRAGQRSGEVRRAQADARQGRST